jgi:hypothetical protein
VISTKAANISTAVIGLLWDAIMERYMDDHKSDAPQEAAQNVDLGAWWANPPNADNSYFTPQKRSLKLEITKYFTYILVCVVPAITLLICAELFGLVGIGLGAVLDIIFLLLLNGLHSSAFLNGMDDS